jgi:hypothetical protein
MIGIAIFLVTWLIGSEAAEELRDGTTVHASIDSLLGDTRMYKFHLSNLIEESDLSISLTTFSDWSDPDLFVKAGSNPSESDYTWSSAVWGVDTLAITSDELTSDTDYYILVSCYTYCRYSLTASYSQEVSLIEGEPFSDHLEKNLQKLYSFTTSSETSEKLEISVTPTSGTLNIYVTSGAQEPSAENSIPIDESWHSGLVVAIPNPAPDTLYRIMILAIETTNYTIKASSSLSAELLQASVPTQGSVDSGKYAYYKINVDDPEETLLITVTPFNGDPDIYVKYNAKPTTTSYDFRSVQFGNETLAISKHDRQSIDHSTGLYYIAVYGFSQAQFTIFASVNKDSAIPLFPGTPQNGYADFNETDYYYMEVPSTFDSNVTFSLSTEQGNPDLFAKLCNENESLESCKLTYDEIVNPQKYAKVFSSQHATGEDVLYIPHSASSCNTCVYKVGVYGQSSTRSTFSISGTYSDDTEHVLREGSPIRMTIPREGYRYFRYNLANETALNVTFQLTPISGDPDLFVSRNITRPSKDNAEKNSRNSLTKVDSVSYVKGIDGKNLNGTYHIAVYAFSMSSFTIVAQTKMPDLNSTVQLYPGQAQSDTLYNVTDGEYRIYSFNVMFSEENKQPIRITLTPISGSYAMYVANSPNNLDREREIFYYDWCTCAENREDHNYVVNIKTTDGKYKAQTTYLVLVVATYFTSDDSASYSIMYNIGNGTISLQEAVPYMDEVGHNEYKYYLFPIYLNHEDVTITVTAMTGDPDLYVSVNPENPKPTQLSFDFSASAFGSETLSMTWEQKLAEACPSLPDEYQFGDLTYCMLYIGVYGSNSPSTYSILVNSRRQLPTHLLLGTPQTGQLNRTLYDYYYAYTNTDEILEISLMPNSGDSDLFINILDKRQAGPNITSWKRPNRENAMYWSMSTVVAEHLTIEKESLKEACPTGDCIALVGVYCFSDLCRYTLNARQDGLFVLLEGDVVYGNVDSRKYVYYDFYIDKDDASFLITLSSISDGDPDLFVNKGSSKKPTEKDYMWSSVTWKGETLLITSSDSQFQGGSMKGHYIIGVYGYTTTAYTISIHLNPNPIRRLNSGQPSTVDQARNSVTYFSFFNSMVNKIKIVMTPNSGSANLLVNSQDEFLEDIYDRLPSINSYMWSGMASNDQYSITIDSDDPNFCTLCNIVIGVLTGDSACNYSIVAFNDLNIQLLMNGVPRRSYLKSGEWSYYSFRLVDRTDFDISVTAYSGDPDVYVSTSNAVSILNYNWTSAGVDRISHLHIEPTDPAYIVGVYTIGIFGFRDSSYSIVAHTRDSFVELVTGWSQTYSLGYNSNDRLYFTLNRQDSTNTTSCTLISLSPDFYPRVYVDLQYNLDEVRKPNPTNAALKFEDKSLYEEPFSQLMFELSNEDRQSGGKWVFGVYGREDEDHSKKEMGEFEFQCSSSAQIATLKVGNIDYSLLKGGINSRRYELNVEEEGTLEVYVVPCAGRVKMEISSNYTIINQNLPDVEVVTLVEGKLSGTINKAKGKYFVTISTLKNSELFEGTSYQISTRFTPKGQRRPGMYVSGNEGFIEWKRSGREEVKLDWSPIEKEDGSTTSFSNQVQYIIYWTKEKIPMNTACGMYNAVQMGKAFIVDSTTGDTELEVELDNDVYAIVNVVGVIPDEENTLLRYIPYYPLEIDMRTHGRHRGIGLTIFWVVAALLFIALTASIIFYRKFKRVQRKLEYEMTDVRNIAGVSSGSLEFQALSRNANYDPLASERS